VQFTIFSNKVLDYIFVFLWGLLEDQRAEAYFGFEGWECQIYWETRSDQRITCKL